MSQANTSNGNLSFGDRPNKARQLLGLDPYDDRETVSVATHSLGPSPRPGSMFGFGASPIGSCSLAVQKQGFLFKKSFYKKNLMNKWSRSFFILKDGFLIWFKKKPGGAYNFTLNPQGYIPLGGCTIMQEGKQGKGFVIAVTNPEFGNRELLLKVNEQEEAIDWVQHLIKGSKVAVLSQEVGNAKLLLLKSKGTRQEEENLKLLNDSREKARLAIEASEERQRLMEQQMREKREFRQKLQVQDMEAEAQTVELESQQEKLELKKQEQEKAMLQKQELETKLSLARRGVEQLKLAVLERGGPRKKQLLQDLDHLSTFLQSV